MNHIGLPAGPSTPRASSPGRSTWLLGGLAAASLSIACVGAVDGGGPSKGAGSEATKPGGTKSTPGGQPTSPGGGTTPGNPGGSPGNGTDPGNPSQPPPSVPAGCGLAPGRIWALTPQQYMRTVRSLLPTAAAGIGDTLGASLAPPTGFSNEAGRLGMTEPHVNELLDTVFALATKATGDLAQLAPCLAAAAPDAACQRTFVTQFGARAFRRDLTDEEIGEMTAYLGRETATDLKGGLRRFLMYLFTSPNFAFRTELGPTTAAAGTPLRLTPFERAQTLSYFLTDGPPDPELAEAARKGGLGDVAEIEAHTRRLLAKPEGAVGFTKLFRELFETAAPKDADKDPMVFPEWKESLAADLASADDAFLQQVLWGEDGKLSTLLTADFSMLNPPLAAFYGVSGAGPTGFTKIKQPAGQRAGILTQAGHLAALAKNNDTDPVARGRFVRESLLCQALPPPPGNLAPVPPPPDGKSNGRERLAQHSSDPSCAGCHTLMDPLGLAFESYDGIGRFRSTDLGKAIDASGKLTGAEPEGASFANAVELMKLLGSSPTVGKCFVGSAFRYATGRDAGAQDSCTIDRLSKRFASSGGDLLDLAVAITTDETFFVRQGR
jgi:hypothetical protein